MKEHDIRHVPIKQGEQVVGIISERDLRWMRSPALLLPDPEEIPVAHVQVNNLYTVEILDFGQNEKVFANATTLLAKVILV